MIHDLLIAPFDLGFMRRALVGCFALSLAAPPLGLFLVLRRMSLTSDVLQHGILPGLALGAANMVLLGIGLAASNLRRASNWNLLFALLSFVVYYNVINLTQAWVAAGKTSMGTALVAAHGGAFLIAMTLLWWREHGNSRLGWRGAAGRVAADAQRVKGRA